MNCEIRTLLGKSFDGTLTVHDDGIITYTTVPLW